MTKKINWPEDGDAMEFSDLVNSIEDVIKHCYTVRRKNVKKDVVWNGPNLPKCVETMSVDFSDVLKASALKYQNDDNDRSAMEIIIGIAIQLGIEQGRRAFKGELKSHFSIVDNKLNDLNESLDRLKDHT